MEVNKVEEKNYKAKENFKNSEEKIYKAKESFHSSGEEIYKGKKVLNSSEEGFYMELNELEAMEFLFYPIKSYFNFNKDTPSFLNSWIPLPLYIENLDCI